MSGKLVNGPLFARVSTGNHEVSRRAPPADGKRTLLGVDENGLGPLLGPLVVTAARARATESGASFAAKKARGARKTRLGDSKGLVAFVQDEDGDRPAGYGVTFTELSPEARPLLVQYTKNRDPVLYEV